MSKQKEIASTKKAFNPNWEDRKKSSKNTVSPQFLARQIAAGNMTALSQGITLIESNAFKHQLDAQTLLSLCLPHSNKALRIGITGVPGVGKSTFIEAFGTRLTAMGKKVAVLAVDPSSSISRGSILGDKTRMSTLTQNPKAYIRPSASGETLGGVARKTREATILCEAAGYDVVIIETVGVGQSETAVHAMVDFFLLLKLAGAGDELQGIKRGIIEMADAIVINKADGANLKNAALAKTAFAKALHLYPPKASDWSPKVMLCSALKEEGIDGVQQMIWSYFEKVKHNGFFEKNRILQNKNWFFDSVNDQLKRDFYQKKPIKKKIEALLAALANNQLTPFAAAAQLFEEA